MLQGSEMITEEQKLIFEKGNDLIESGECEHLTITQIFQINGDNFYMVRYEGHFVDNDERMTHYKYSCFFDSYDKANVWETELAAELDALCLYQKMTGKKLPQ